MRCTVGNRQGRRRACGVGRQRPVPGHGQVSLFNRHQQMRLTPDHPESMHCQERFRDPTHSTQQKSKAADCHGNSFERTTRRRTSPSVHACPAPHLGKTQRPDRHVSTHSHTALPGVPRCEQDSTNGLHQPSAPGIATCTQDVVSTPAVSPRRMRAPCMQARPEHVCSCVHAGQVQETKFSDKAAESKKMAKYEKPLPTAIHAQTSYRHGVNWPASRSHTMCTGSNLIARVARTRLTYAENLVLGDLLGPCEDECARAVPACGVRKCGVGARRESGQRHGCGEAVADAAGGRRTLVGSPCSSAGT